MSVVGPIAAKKLQGRECSEVFSLQQNSLVIQSSRPYRRTPAIAERNLWNAPQPADQSGLMFANLITLAARRKIETREGRYRGPADEIQWAIKRGFVIPTNSNSPSY